jgi:hypothetical protein
MATPAPTTAAAAPAQAPAPPTADKAAAVAAAAAPAPCAAAAKENCAPPAVAAVAKAAAAAGSLPPPPTASHSAGFEVRLGCEGVKPRPTPLQRERGRAHSPFFVTAPPTTTNHHHPHPLQKHTQAWMRARQASTDGSGVTVVTAESIAGVLAGGGSGVV